MQRWHHVGKPAQEPSRLWMCRDELRVKYGQAGPVVKEKEHS